MKKLLAWALTLIMTAQLLPLTVWAADVDDTVETQVLEPQDTYQSDLEGMSTSTMDAATAANLNSIWNQLETTGLVAYSALDTSTKVLDLSAFDSDYLTTTTEGSTVALSLGTVTVPAGESSSFRWDIVGLNPTWNLSLVVVGVGSYNSGNQVYLTNNTSEDKTFTLEIYVMYAPGSGYDTAMNDFDGYTGMIYNALSFSNPVNMMFYQDGIFRDNGTVFMGFNKGYSFYGYSGSWVNAYYPEGDVSQDYNYYAAAWRLISLNEMYNSSMIQVQLTADAIFGDGDQWYDIKTDWTASGFTAPGYTINNDVWMESASIWPYDSNGNRMGVETYYSTNRFKERERVTNYQPFYLIGTEGYTWTNFPISFSLNQWYSNNTYMNTLEMLVTGDAMPACFFLEGNPNYKAVSGSATLSNGQVTTAQLWQMYTNNRSIEIYDTFAPTVVDVYGNDGFPLADGATPGSHNYSSGQYIPITLEFSEPVDGSKLSVKINNVTYSAEELHMNTTSAIQTAWYQVQDVDNISIIVSEVTGMEDLFGNTTASQNNGGENWVLSNITMESALMRNSVKGSVVDTDLKTVALTLNQAEAYQTKYAAYDTSGSVDKMAPFKAQVVAPDGSDYEDAVQFYLTEDALGTTLSAYATLPALPIVDDALTYTVEIYAYESTADTEGFRLWWYDGDYGSVAKTQLESVAIDYDDESITTLSLSESYTPALGVNYTPSDLTCPGGTWSSSDETIATIDEDGNVLLNGNKVGAVSFTFTAHNGTTDTSDDKTATTHTYTVQAGDRVSLAVPNTFQNIVVRQGNPTTVFWNSNASLMSGYGTVEYKVEVFKDRFATANDITGTAVYSETFSDAVNSYVIPATAIADLGNYTVCISIPATENTVELTALAWVTVNAQQAGISLTAPTSLYLLDSETAGIDWSISNYVDTVTDATLTVTRVQEDSTASVVETKQLTAGSGTYTFDPTAVDHDDLKDTYMFSAKVTNNATDADDIDGFIMYVYRDGALELEIDNTSLSNTSVVSSNLPTNTAAILALREELALIEYVGINYHDYSWRMLKDGIAWDTTNVTGEAGDSDIVTINYKQGSLYENIDNFTMSSYLPQTQMLLSSVTDGTAKITATHANTGMSDSVNVTIDTLRDEFYLFQVSPMLTTELTYTDGKGAVKSVWTNGEGYLALYEPEGIASEVDLWAKTGDTVYLGSIAQEDLTSGERDATKLQLYPLNTATMRQVAQLDLYVTNPDGSPFVGSLTLRGGVYVDAVYADQAQLRGNGDDRDWLYDGDEDQTVAITDGYLTINFDSTQFGDDAENLTAKNEIQYILELSDITSGGTTYYPQLVYSSATMSLDDIMYAASSIITLEDATGNLNTPFIDRQYFLYEDLSRELDIQTFTGRIGPNANYESATVYTNMLLWGEEADTGYTLYAVDENGYQPADTMNKSEEYTYAFSSIPVVRNTLTLTQATMTDSGWIKEMTDRGIKLRLSSSTAMVQEKTMPWRVLDMTKVEDVMENSDVSTMVSEMLSGSSLGTSDSASSGNAIISGLMGFVTPFIGDIDGSPFNIIITPTENNAVFNCLIWGGYDGMGLDEVDYSDTGLALESDVMNASLSVTGVSDLMGMAGGGDDDGGEIPYDTDPEPSSSTGSWGASFEGQLQGYYQGEISYNFTTGKWEMHVLEGGFTAGFQGAATFSVDTSASGIPLFLEVELGGAVQLDFKMATRYQQIGSNVWASSVESDTVNDYLTTLRLLASAGVFGGIGFDYSIVSFKIGPYGEASIDSSNLFLTRDYLADVEAQDTDGQYLKIEGEIGAKMEATFLLFSTKVIFGSGSASYAWDWDAASVQAYWDDAATYGTGLNDLNAYSAQYAAAADVTTLANATTLQSRDYLSEASVWASPIMTRSLDGANGLAQLQSNANPSSYPVVSDDGAHLLYISDQGDESIYANRVYAGALHGTTYTQGSVIDDHGYGDSNVSISGDEDFATAAWVRMTSEIEGKDAGDAVTLDEQVMLLNGTEIMVSLWNGSQWETSALTTNGTPDLAPAVATNDRGDAIVAWRSVYSGTGADLMTFDAQDYIMYSVYDSNNGWSEAKTLYNGSAGSVMGLDAKMLDDGTAMVAYTIDRDNTDGEVTDYEIAYSIVDDAGAVSLSTVVTSDDYLDENPQIVVADFGTTGNPDDRFVLGWYNNRDNVGDVRLLAVNADGIVSNSFPESLAKITATTNTTIASDFRFAAMDSAHNNLENLTILWEDIIVTETGEADYSVIRAVSFTDDESRNIGLTAVANLAQLPSGTLLDHFDAYVSGTNEVKAVIQSTHYDTADTTAMEYSWDDNGITKYSTVNIPSEATMLYTATQLFENRVEVQSAVPDYQNLALNTYNAIQFSVFNGGLEDIDSVELTIDGEKTTYTNLNLAPNDSAIVTYWHKIGTTVSDTAYTLTANFDSGDTKTVYGSIYLDYPDVGISQMNVIKEEDGLRTIRMSLYNASIATLAGNKGRSVELSFYDGADFNSANVQSVTCSSSGVSVANGVLTITGEENLKRIDDGVFMVELTYDVKEYVEDTLELEEIPHSGVRLYAHADIVDGDRVLPELSTTDNTASVSFDSLLTRVGETITLDIDQSNSETATTATVTLKNNSLQTQTAGGAMIVSLLDDQGNALEQKQVTIGSGTMAGEAVYSETVTFSKVGASVSVVYGELTTGSTELAMLNLGGGNLTHSDFEYYGRYILSDIGSCTVYNTNLSGLDAGEHLISCIPKDDNAEVTITSYCYDDSIGSTPVEHDTVVLKSSAMTRIAITITLDGVAATMYYIYVAASEGSQQITINPSCSDSNGSIASTDPVSVDYGSTWWTVSNALPETTPAANYVLDGWYIVGTDTQVGWETDFTQNYDLEARFKLESHSISYSNPTMADLTLVDNGSEPYDHWYEIYHGDDYKFKLSQTSAQYVITDVYYIVGDTRYELGAFEEGKTYTIENVTSDMNIGVDWVQYHKITIEAGTNSTMTPRSVTFYARDYYTVGGGTGLYASLEDLISRTKATTLGVTPTANAGYRLGADNTDNIFSEALWVRDGRVYATSEQLLDGLYIGNETYTVHAIKTWNTTFVSADSSKGTVGTESDDTYDVGTVIPLPTVTPADGYVLDRWDATTTGDTVTSGDGAHNGANTTETFTAIFKAGTWDIYYPTNLNGVSVTGAREGTYGQPASFTLSSGEYDVTGVYYTVAGSGTKTCITPVGDTYTIPADAITGDISITMEANGVETVYVVAGDNGAVIGQTAINVATGDTMGATFNNVTLHPDTGYELGAWAPENPSDTPIGGSATFTASFAPCTYTLSFDTTLRSGNMYEGKAISPISVTYGAPITGLVAADALEGSYDWNGVSEDYFYPFMYWTVETTAPDGSRYDLVLKEGDTWTLTGDQTAVAEWWWQCVVDFVDVADSSVIESQYVEQGATVIQPTNPTKTGYSFDAWYEDGASEAYTFTEELLESKTLYAHWTANHYTLAFDLAGGSGTVASKTVTYDSAIGGLGTPVKTGYTFDGWSIGGVKITATTNWSYGENKTAVANWIPDGDTAYTVMHQQQNLDGSYTTVETENKTGASGAWVTPSVNSYTGFALPATQTASIAGDGSLVITYSYDRTLHRINFVVGGNATSTGVLTYTDVMYGDTITAPVVTPKTGYTFDGWDTAFSATVTGDVTYTAQVNIIVCTVYFLNDVDGTLIEAQSIDYGDTLTLPDTSQLSLYGYTFVGWSSYTYVVTANTTVYALWTPIQYYVSFDANGGAGIMGNQTFTYGETAKPLTANAYTHDIGNFMGWSTDNTVAASYGDKEKVSTHSTTANEVVDLYAIWGVDVTWDYGDGTTNTTEEGIGVAITEPATPVRSGYTFRGWYLDDGTAYDFATPVSEAFTLTAQWAEVASSSISYYTSTVADAVHGAVSLSGNRNAMNSTVTITATPDAGYAVDAVTVTYLSGRDVTVTAKADGTYTYLQPGASVTVTVTFVSVGDGTMFSDVASGVYYYDAVLWAVEQGITTGYTDGTFRPDTVCNRAQAVTFLWRCAGEPKATGENPFTDVSETAYYYDAVLWAVEQGITNGTTSTTFAPNDICSRGQIVTFLYRANGAPAVTGDCAFTDVRATAYYYNAVLWAVEQGITTGNTLTTFAPYANCTRGQIVTFLYRNRGE